MTKLSKSSDTAFLMQQANAAPELDRELEGELIARWQAGDAKAREALVRCHQRYVLALALKYRHYGVPVSELVGEGNLGVVLALARFDPARGVRFGTYAAHWVRAQMLACVVKSGRAVSGSDGPLRSQLFFRLRRERARVFGLLGAGETADRELAARLGVSLERVQRLNQRLDARDVPLDVTSSDERAAAVERLAAPHDQEHELFTRQVSGALRAGVEQALARLDARERVIIEHRQLSEPGQERSLAEIARSMGVSRERARQLEQRAILKLKRIICASSDPVLREWLQTELVTAAA
ncbi:MAG TPA: sigma-70 family RNA polymerase sigma factor [Polyangiaceae bacterium]|nr:sigma-70 family RNA polymerase sigma factor [Polyangiaceae bacterium]